MQDCRPTVSVVIPAYNSAHLLPDAVRSVLGQTRPPDEVIVVDDGSTDDTPSVLAEFGNRLRIVAHAENRGLPAARNTGIRAATGSLIALLDADDAWLPRMVEKQVEEFARHPDLGLCFTALQDCDAALRPHGKAWPKRRRSAEWVFEELYLHAFPMPPSTVFVRRAVFDQAGYFDESMIKKQDIECWLRIAMLFKVSCINEPLCLRRLHPGSLTNAKSVEENLYYEDRLFTLCGAAAQRFGVHLPLDVGARQALLHRRRMFEMLSYCDLDAARVYLAAMHRDGPLPMRDRLLIPLLTYRARVWPRLRVVRRLLQPS
jgi:glycosyltransferase involved in cell wall biosynthesis